MMVVQATGVSKNFPRIDFCKMSDRLLSPKILRKDRQSIPHAHPKFHSPLSKCDFTDPYPRGMREGQGLGGDEMFDGVAKDLRPSCSY